MGTFRDRFGRPGKGNDKGKVEGLVKYTLMTPLPHAASFEALNAALIERCRARRSRGRPTLRWPSIWRPVSAASRSASSPLLVSQCARLNGRMTSTIDAIGASGRPRTARVGEGPASVLRSAVRIKLMVR
jgi:hypothetical protein